MAEGDPSDRPDWAVFDREMARDLVGTRVLVGITRVGADGDVIEKLEVYGMVISADESRGIAIEVHGEKWKGQTFWMPPSTGSFQRARPGKYHLRSTDEIVTDPDYTTSWTFTREKN